MIWFPAWQEIVFFFKICRLEQEPTQPPVWCVSWVLSIGVEQLLHKADHCPSSSVMLN